MSHNSPDPKGVALMVEAQKRLDKSGFIASLFGGNDQRFEDARELYHKAAAQFKLQKQWAEAGEAYAKAAELSLLKLKDVYEACTDYNHAAKAYKNCNTELAIKYLQIAVDLQMENNKLNSAARLWKELGELHEKELNYAQASHSYGKAADCFEAEDSQVNASACSIKVAELEAEQEHYVRAIEVYEQVSMANADHSRTSVKNHLFAALLCQFIVTASTTKQDMTEMDRVIRQYIDMLPQLNDTRELKLIMACVEAFKDDDMDLFTDLVFKYDEIYKLSNWQAKVLLQIKNKLRDGGNNINNTDVDVQ